MGKRGDKKIGSPSNHVARFDEERKNIPHEIKVSCGVILCFIKQHFAYLAVLKMALLNQKKIDAYCGIVLLFSEILF